MEIYTPKLQHHEDLTIMDSALLNNLLEVAEDSIYSTGLCRIALAGGTTPKNLYKKISNLTLDWNSRKIFRPQLNRIKSKHDSRILY
jgi:6-phosphogluconolactonase/glucosamine-6-phosphate isomerase/deaminase